MEKQKQGSYIGYCAKPEHYHETALASFVLENPLSEQGTWPAAEQFPNMKSFFRYAPILVLGKVLVFPVEQNGQQTVHRKGNAQA